MSAPMILVAEDDAKFRREVGLFLGKHRYAVITVEDGYQALEYAIKEEPDLLVLDVHMPAGDGFSVHERVQRHPELALKPVIYMSHDPSPELEAQAEEHGAFALLHKPFELDELLRLIETALNPAEAA